MKGAEEPNASRGDSVHDAGGGAGEAPENRTAARVRHGDPLRIPATMSGLISALALSRKEVGTSTNSKSRWLLFQAFRI